MVFSLPRYTNSASITKAAQAAQSANVAIVFVAVEAGEGTDRANLSLSGNQDELIFAISKVQPKTIVVLHVPGAVLMDWADSVSAILCAFYPGQENGTFTLHSLSRSPYLPYSWWC